MAPRRAPAHEIHEGIAEAIRIKNEHVVTRHDAEDYLKLLYED